MGFFMAETATSLSRFLRAGGQAALHEKRRRKASRAAACLAALCLAVCPAGCAVSPEKKEMLFYAMDTAMELTAYGDGAEQGINEAYQYILKLDRLLTNKDEDSEISGLSRAAGQADVTVSPETAQVIDAALEYCRQSGGLFDITIAPLTSLWDIGPEKTSRPADSDIEAARALVDYRRLLKTGENAYRLAEPKMAVDLGAVAKGFASDGAAGILKGCGVKSALISLGGNIYCVGAKPDGKPWRIGLRDPDGKAGDYFAIVRVTDKAVVTSGDYERYFTLGGVRYHHIIDPRTGLPARSGLRSVTVIADSGTLADAFSTALFVMGVEEAMAFQKRHGGFEAVFVTEDKQVVVTEGLRDIFEFRGGQEGYGYED